MVVAGNNMVDVVQNNERGMVVQQFCWADQMQALKITEDGNAHLPHIDEDAVADQAKDQIAFMASTTPDSSNSNEVSNIA